MRGIQKVEDKINQRQTNQHSLEGRGQYIATNKHPPALFAISTVVVCAFFSLPFQFTIILQYLDYFITLFPFIMS